MKVLFVVPECYPYAKTGGLADVMSTLPEILSKKGINTAVVMPNYGDIPYYFKKKMERRADFKVNVGWRKKNCTVHLIEHKNIKFFFISNEHYFEREGLYGHGDDIERFTFFNNAVLEMMLQLDEIPDIIHCHEWQTALISIYLKNKYNENARFKDVKTVFSVHNLMYQGIFPPHVLEDVMGLDGSFFTPEELEYFGNINLLKGALKYSDFIITTSPSLAEKLKTPEYGGPLCHFFQEKEDRLLGIVNGVDHQLFNPQRDPHISFHYDREVSAVEEKRKNKLYFQRLFSLPEKKEIPMMVIISNLKANKGFKLVLNSIPELMKFDLQLVVLGVGDEEFEQGFKAAAWENPLKVSTHITFNEDLARKLYASGDFFLQPSREEPCGTGPLIAMRYLTVPIIRQTGGLSEYITSFTNDPERGTGFVFEKYEKEDFLKTVGSALSCYKRQQEWEKIIKNIINNNYCWNQSAAEYIDIYNKLQKNRASAD